VLGAFIFGGLIAFPLTILIAVTGAAFGIWPGLLYAAGGAMASAILMYRVGRWLGQKAVARTLGSRAHQLKDIVARRGVFAIAAIRLVPLAPFSIVNLAAGAAVIDLRLYIAGTFLGLVPGILMLTFFSEWILRVLSSPNLIEVSILLTCIVGWVATTLAIQAPVSKSLRIS